MACATDYKPYPVNARAILPPTAYNSTASGRY